MFQPVILSPYPQTNILSSAPRHLQLQVLHRLPDKEDLCQGNQRTRHVLAYPSEQTFHIDREDSQNLVKTARVSCPLCAACPRLGIPYDEQLHQALVKGVKDVLSLPLKFRKDNTDQDPK